MGFTKVQFGKTLFFTISKKSRQVCAALLSPQISHPARRGQQRQRRSQNSTNSSQVSEGAQPSASAMSPHSNSNRQPRTKAGKKWQGYKTRINQNTNPSVSKEFTTSDCLTKDPSENRPLEQSSAKAAPFAQIFRLFSNMHAPCFFVSSQFVSHKIFGA